MKPLTCAAARQQLAEFYDGELAVAEQIAVTTHLEECRRCAEELAELRAVGGLLRASTPGREVLSPEESVGFGVSVVSRVKAEREVSFFARVRGMFDDLHLVYAGLGSAAATAVCIVIMLGMMRFASDERPDSLAAMLTILSTPGSSASMLAIDAASHARWSARFSAANESAEEDAVFALASVIARDGHLSAADRSRARGRAASADAQLVDGLLDAVSRARFGMPPNDALPTSANMVWLIAHTTVRASAGATTVDLPLPAAKKRAATYIYAPRGTMFV